MSRFPADILNRALERQLESVPGGAPPAVGVSPLSDEEAEAEFDRLVTDVARTEGQLQITIPGLRAGEAARVQRLQAIPTEPILPQFDPNRFDQIQRIILHSMRQRVGRQMPSTLETVVEAGVPITPGQLVQLVLADDAQSRRGGTSVDDLLAVARLEQQQALARQSALETARSAGFRQLAEQRQGAQFQLDLLEFEERLRRSGEELAAADAAEQFKSVGGTEAMVEQLQEGLPLARVVAGSRVSRLAQAGILRQVLQRSAREPDFLTAFMVGVAGEPDPDRVELQRRLREISASNQPVEVLFDFLAEEDKDFRVLRAISRALDNSNDPQAGEKFNAILDLSRDVLRGRGGLTPEETEELRGQLEGTIERLPPPQLRP